MSQLPPRARKQSGGRRRKRRKSGSSAGLIVGLSFGGVALLGVVILVVVINSSNDGGGVSDTTDENAGNPLTLLDANGDAPEPEPFHNQGMHAVGPLSEIQVKLSNARFRGFGSTGTGFPHARWQIDYEFVGEGFQPSRLRHAYQLHARGNKLEAGNIPAERGWKLRHPLNEKTTLPQEASAEMLGKRGTVDLTWVISKDDLAGEYVFWVEREEPGLEFFRVSNYVAADSTDEE